MPKLYEPNLEAFIAFIKSYRTKIHAEKKD